MLCFDLFRIPTKNLVHVVVDTNVFISDLTRVQEMLNGDSGGLIVFIPWSVTRELDKLKTTGDDTPEIAARARQAINFVHDQLLNRNQKVPTSRRHNNAPLYVQIVHIDGTLLTLCRFVVRVVQRKSQLKFTELTTPMTGFYRPA